MKFSTLKIVVIITIAAFFISIETHAQDANSREQRENRTPPSVDEIFEKMDANEDGLLSKAELKGPLKEQFNKIDTNEDGFLSKEEVEAAPKPKGRGPKKR